MRKIVPVLAFTVLFFLLVLEAGATDKIIYKSVSASDKVAALSFDDGPHKTQTDAVLDVLKKHNIKATFFVIGKNAIENPEVLRRIADEGHEIGNHTYSHSLKKKVSEKVIEEEITKNEETILELCELQTRLLRPPGGRVDSNLLKIAERLDYKIILWDVDTRDWAHTPADRIVENVLKNTQNGSIILFHDYVFGNSDTAIALDIVITELTKKGFKFVTVGELIGTD